MELKWSAVAEKSLSKLERATQADIINQTETYAATGHGDVKKLQGRKPPEFRLRLGNWRVTFTREGPVMTVLDVCDRRDAYR